MTHLAPKLRDVRARALKALSTLFGLPDEQAVLHGPCLQVLPCDPSGCRPEVANPEASKRSNSHKPTKIYNVKQKTRGPTSFSGNQGNLDPWPNFRNTTGEAEMFSQPAWLWAMGKQHWNPEGETMLEKHNLPIEVPEVVLLGMLLGP